MPVLLGLPLWTKDCQRRSKHPKINVLGIVWTKTTWPMSKKIQICQNKCIRYCLNQDDKAHVSINEFIKINWLVTKERFAQCICVNICKFVNKMSPQYISEIFHPSYSRYNTRVATLKPDLPLWHSCLDQKPISYLRPKTWDNLPAKIKLVEMETPSNMTLRNCFLMNFKSKMTTYSSTIR